MLKKTLTLMSVTIVWIGTRRKPEKEDKGEEKYFSATTPILDIPDVQTPVPGNR